MKSTKEVYSQDQRVSRLLYSVSKQLIKNVHPETGGCLHLSHNWGNAEAKKILDNMRKREHRIYAICQSLYKEAFKREYPSHLANRTK